MNIVITGLSWAGRDRLAKCLAARIGGRFIDGPDLHPASTRRKLASRAPLTPDDHAAWLDAIGLKIGLRGQGTVVTCAALRAEDRARIRTAAQGDLTLVQVVGTPETLAARMAPESEISPGTADRLAAHIRRLDVATPGEGVLTLDLAMPQRQMIDAILEAEGARLSQAAAPHPVPRAPDQGLTPNA